MWIIFLLNDRFKENTWFEKKKKVFSYIRYLIIITPWFGSNYYCSQYNIQELQPLDIKWFYGKIWNALIKSIYNDTCMHKSLVKSEV